MAIYNSPPVESLSIAQVAYVAGLFDGEGCIQLIRDRRKNRTHRSFRMFVLLNNTDKSLVEFLIRCFGGRVYKYHPAKNPKYAKAWQWSLAAGHARNFLKTIRPYLVGKSLEADIAIEYQERVDPSYRGAPLPSEEYEARNCLYNQLLNARAARKEMAV